MKNIPTINIDMDKKCEKCGAGGACQNGLCLECTTQRLVDQNMLSVGEKTLEEILRQTQGLFELYEEKINWAIKKNQNALDVTFTAKLKVFADGQVAVQMGISFTSEKIKDIAILVMVSENQEELDFKE